MKVLVECFPDTALVRALGIARRDVGHEHCKGNVLRGLARWDGEAIGIVDADTGKQDSIPGLMAKYQEEESAHGLRFMRHREDGRKRLVEIAPYLEEWLVTRSGACEKRLGDYRLPETGREMRKVRHIERRPGFERLVKDLAAADPGMKMLKKWVVG